MENQCDIESEFAETFRHAVAESQKEPISEYASDARALHNIALLSEVYRKLVDGIIRVEQSEELYKYYTELDRAFRKVIKCESTDIMLE